MDQHNKQPGTKKKSEAISRHVRIILAISLAIISIFPFFVTFAPQEWPLQRGVILVDIIYLLVLAGSIPIITGWSRSRLLLFTVGIVSALGVLGMIWLIVTLGTLDIG